MFAELLSDDVLQVVLHTAWALVCVWIFGRLFQRILRDEREVGRQEGRTEIIEGMKRLNRRVE